MKFVKDSFKHLKKETDSNSIVYCIWKWIGMEEKVVFVYKLMRFVDSSIKSCENCLYYAWRKRVPVTKSVRNSEFSF